MIKRTIEEEVLKHATFQPVVFITGPRQCGKTTLARELFPHYKYVNLEDKETRAYVAANIKNFLAEMEKESGVIIDEFQYVPDITSYLKVKFDELIGKGSPRPGFYILTGSQNFLMVSQVTQTLVGLATLIEMLPLSLTEIASTDAIEDILFRGLYPQPYQQHENLDKVRIWAKSYISFYLERDAKALKKDINVLLFHKFIKLLAARVGNVLNVNSLSIDCGIDVKTVYQWLDILSTYFIITLISPFYENFSRQLIKAPKIYFVDTALVCSLLDIESPAALAQHPDYGALFENMIIMELIKARTNVGKSNNVHFWREDQGLEVDAVLHYALHLRAVEIKAAKTIKSSLAAGITKWKKAIKEHAEARRYVIYGGEENQVVDDIPWVSWRKCDTINFSD